MSSLPSSSSSSIIQSVLNYKEVLEKEISKAGTTGVGSDGTIDVERCNDIIEQLQGVQMTYNILNETLIGVTVNKLKSNVKLQPKVKILIKLWKQVANTNTNTNTTSSSTGNSSDTIRKAAAPVSGGGKVAAKAIKESKAASVAAAMVSGGGGGKRNGDRDMVNNDNDDDDEDNDVTAPTIDPSTAFLHLKDSPRISFCQKLYLIFQKQERKLTTQEQYHPTTLPTLFMNQCIDMETSVHQKYKLDKKGYADKARSLLFNLNKNTTLTMSILLGQVQSTEIMNYTTEQLANEQTQLLRQVTTQKLIDSKRLDWNEANEDKINDMCGIKGDLLNASLFTCGRCKSIKTTSTQKQTRSADEPMTVFVLCLNCGKRWKC